MSRKVAKLKREHAGGDTSAQNQIELKPFFMNVSFMTYTLESF